MLDSGDVIRVPRGASPPADGVVVLGEGSFDESSLTGESRPMKKMCGSDVYSGTVNVGVPVTVKVTSVVGKSMLDQIVDIVRECQTKPAPMARIADVMTSYFVPAITLIAILTWIIWMSLGLSGRIPADWLHVNSGGWVAWSLQFATAVFIVACPCGLALAAPTAIFVGSGLAAKHGILVRGGGEAFEKASKINCVVFDKTGTLTVGGEPRITDSQFYTTDDDAGEDVGIAIGTGSDVAISSADFVLLNSDLQSVINLLNMSRMVFRRIKFNFGWAIVYNCIAIPVAAGCFYPIVSSGSHIRLDPVWASLAIALSSICCDKLACTEASLPGVGFRIRKVE